MLIRHFLPVSAMHNIVCPHYETVPKVGKKSASSYWHNKYLLGQQQTWHMTPYSLLCKNFRFISCVFYTSLPIYNHPDCLGVNTNTVLIAHNPRDGIWQSYLSSTISLLNVQRVPSIGVGILWYACGAEWQYVIHIASSPGRMTC